MLGVSVSPVSLDSAQHLLDMFPEVRHLQVKLPPRRDERQRLEQRIAAIRAANPDTELSFHAHGQINLAEAVGFVREAWIELCRDALRQASDMGGKFVVFHGGSVQGKNPVALRAAARSALCGAMEQLLETADDLGIGVHLENIYPAPFRSELVRLLDRVEDYKYLLGAISHPRLKYCFDFGHAMIDDRGMPILSECVESLGSVHVHENDRQNDLHLPPTELFDWKAYIDDIIASGFSGPFILENKPEMLPQAIAQFTALAL